MARQLDPIVTPNVIEPRLADELDTMQREPLLPVEKKLIAWSLGLGVFLLVVLAAVSRVVM